MRKLISIPALLLLLALADLGGPAARVPAFQPQGLRSYVGKYPSALLKGEPSLRARLRAVMGANYNFFMARFQTEMPIEEIEGCLVLVGCMAHSCGSEDAVMVINLTDGKMHCAIRSKKFNGGYRTFSEDKKNIPHALYKMMEQY